MNVVGKINHYANSTARNCWVIGVGSPHGDDRVGWEVVDRLAKQKLRATPDNSPLRLQKAAVPHDILDWISPGACVHIVDAISDSQPAVRRFQIACNSVGELTIAEWLESAGDRPVANPVKLDLNDCGLQFRSNSTHQFDLLSALELIATLGQMPASLWLWTISIHQTDINASLSNAAELLVADCTQQISIAVGLNSDALQS
jgi:hydrogenase maturation protease